MSDGLRMVPLTDLRGTTFYIKATAINVVGVQDVNQFPGSNSVVTVGTQRYGVREPVEQVVALIEGRTPDA